MIAPHWLRSWRTDEPISSGKAEAGLGRGMASKTTIQQFRKFISEIGTEVAAAYRFGSSGTRETNCRPPVSYGTWARGGPLPNLTKDQTSPESVIEPAAE